MASLNNFFDLLGDDNESDDPSMLVARIHVPSDTLPKKENRRQQPSAKTSPPSHADKNNLFDGDRNRSSPRGGRRGLDRGRGRGGNSEFDDSSLAFGDGGLFSNYDQGGYDRSYGHVGFYGGPGAYMYPYNSGRGLGRGRRGRGRGRGGLGSSYVLDGDDVNSSGENFDNYGGNDGLHGNTGVFNGVASGDGYFKGYSEGGILPYSRRGRGRGRGHNFEYAYNDSYFDFSDQNIDGNQNIAGTQGGNEGFYSEDGVYRNSLADNAGIMPYYSRRGRGRGRGRGWGFGYPAHGNYADFRGRNLDSNQRNDDTDEGNEVLNIEAAPGKDGQNGRFFNNGRDRGRARGRGRGRNFDGESYDVRDRSFLSNGDTEIQWENEGFYNDLSFSGGSYAEGSRTFNNGRGRGRGRGRGFGFAVNGEELMQRENLIEDKQTGEDTAAVSRSLEERRTGEEDYVMSLDEYEKILNDRRRMLDAVRNEERRVVVDKDFDSMQLVARNHDVSTLLKLVSSVARVRRSVPVKPDKTNKAVSINEFLKPATGRDCISSFSRRSRGRGRGYDFRVENDDSVHSFPPSIEDPVQFPLLSQVK